MSFRQRLEVLCVVVASDLVISHLAALHLAFDFQAAVAGRLLHLFVFACDDLLTAALAGGCLFVLCHISAAGEGAHIAKCRRVVCHSCYQLLAWT